MMFAGDEGHPALGAVRAAVSKRTLMIIGVTVLVVAGLLVATDRVAQAFAEQQVARQLRGQLHTAQDPAVTIRGFPFLTQVAAGDYPDVGLRADRANVGQLQDLTLVADLHHVRVPAGEIVSGTVRHAAVDAITGQLRIPAVSIGRLVGVANLHLDPAPGNAITVSGVGDAFGISRAAVTAGVTVAHDSVLVQPQSVDVRLGAPPGVPLDLHDPQLLARFAIAMDSRELPLGFHPTAVSAEHDALLVGGTVDNVNLG